MPNVISKPSLNTAVLLGSAAAVAAGGAVCLYLLLRSEDNYDLDRHSTLTTRYWGIFYFQCKQKRVVP